MPSDACPYVQLRKLATNGQSADEPEILSHLRPEILQCETPRAKAYSWA